jgi:3-phenylpropionate/cinnamic acid dioxygenase small subunit
MSHDVHQSLPGQAVDRATHFEIERFLIREARALDEERYHEWLDDMLAKDVIYQLPTQEVRYRRDRKTIGNAQTTYLYNDNYEVLAMRVARFDTGFLWAEDPPMRIRRYITNIDAQWAVAVEARETTQACTAGAETDSEKPMGNGGFLLG